MIINLALAVLLPCVHAFAIPAEQHSGPLVVPRDEVFRDVIRLAKCPGLFYRDDQGIHDQGMAAYFEHTDSKTPTKQAIFGMKHRTDDRFVDGDPKTYEGDYEGGGGKMKVTIEKAGMPPAPDKGIAVGNVERTDGTRVWSYSCFTEDWQNKFQWEDPKYRTCRTYVTCVQQDSYIVYVKGSEEVTEGEEDNLPTTGEIMKLFDKAYDNTTGLCDESKIPLPVTGACQVSFECTNNAKDMTNSGPIFLWLKEQLAKFDDPKATGIRTFRDGSGCDGTPGCIPRFTTTVMHQVPKTILLAVKGKPPAGVGREGYEVAKIKSTVTCKNNKDNDKLCLAFKSIFKAVEIVGGPLAGIGGLATEIGCGVVDLQDDE